MEAADGLPVERGVTRRGASVLVADCEKAENEESDVGVMVEAASDVDDGRGVLGVTLLASAEGDELLEGLWCVTFSFLVEDVLALLFLRG